MSNEISYQINSIYPAIEGEGIHIGMAQIFVRFQGCAIGCVNCDSKETWEFSDRFNWPKGKVIAEIEQISQSYKIPVKRVSITGGDPLHPKHVPAVIDLIHCLKANDYQVNIEAAGSRVVPEVFDLVDFISFDVKTPSTQVKTPLQNLTKLIASYPNKFQVKSVVADEVDFNFVLDFYQQAKAQTKVKEIPWVLTPCLEPSENFSAKRFIEIYTLNLDHGGIFRVIGQQHKWVYGVDAINV